jgi:hypothetical protein
MDLLSSIILFGKDEEQSPGIESPPLNREVDPKELPQPATVRRYKELWERIISQRVFLRLMSVKRNPESMILRPGTAEMISSHLRLGRIIPIYLKTHCLTKLRVVPIVKQARLRHIQLP